MSKISQIVQSIFFSKQYLEFERFKYQNRDALIFHCKAKQKNINNLSIGDKKQLLSEQVSIVSDFNDHVEHSYNQSQLIEFVDKYPHALTFFCAKVLPQKAIILSRISSKSASNYIECDEFAQLLQLLQKTGSPKFFDNCRKKGIEQIKGLELSDQRSILSFKKYFAQEEDRLKIELIEEEFNKKIERNDVLSKWYPLFLQANGSEEIDRIHSKKYCLDNIFSLTSFSLQKEQDSWKEVPKSRKYFNEKTLKEIENIIVQPKDKNNSIFAIVFLKGGSRKKLALPGKESQDKLSAGDYIEPTSVTTYKLTNGIETKTFFSCKRKPTEQELLLELSKKTKADAKSFLNLLRINGITCFYHFTSIKNIPSIKQNGGLLSWFYCQHHGINIPVQGGDVDSKFIDTQYGLEDYVHLSFCNDHPMAWRLKQQGDTLVLLKVCIEVAKINSTLFSDINAADNMHSHGETLEDLKRVNFKAVKRKYIPRDDVDFKPHQAEVMVKTFIPVGYILNLENPTLI